MGLKDATRSSASGIMCEFGWRVCVFSIAKVCWGLMLRNRISTITVLPMGRNRSVFFITRIGAMRIITYFGNCLYRCAATWFCDAIMMTHLIENNITRRPNLSVLRELHLITISVVASDVDTDCGTCLELAFAPLLGDMYIRHCSKPANMRKVRFLTYNYLI